MSPFLRWGIFAIVVVGALVFAYNASKDLATMRSGPSEATPLVAPAPTPEQLEQVSASCEAEFTVARQARTARANDDPLDRTLRMREIAFEEDAQRRERLARVARRWFAFEGEIDDLSFRNTVVAECEDFKKP